MIVNNTAEEGGIYVGVDNILYEIYFINTIFIGNSAIDSLISIENSLNIYFINTTFLDNKNLLFSCSSSQINLLYSVVSNLECTNLLPACLAYFTEKAVLMIDTVQIQNVNHLLAEGGIRLDNSYLKISNAYLIGMKTTKKKGSCISGVSSILEINTIYVENYDMNCIFLEETFINLTESYFTNDQQLFEVTQGDFGTIFCKNCLSFNLSFNVFNSNNYVKDGGAITLSSLSLDAENKINSCTFINVKGENQGGALFIDNTNLEINNSSFFGNEAFEGGAIFFQGNKIGENN